MTPYEISIALHYHSRTDDFDHNHGMIWEPTVKWFLEQGLLEPEPPEATRRFKPTQKLHAFVEMLCETPLPIQKWIRPNLDWMTLPK